MSKFNNLNRLMQDLSDSMVAKDAVQMARLYEEFSIAFMKTFKEDDYSYECIVTFCKSTIVCLRYKAYNNMCGSAIEEGEKTLSMINNLLSYGQYTKEQNEEFKRIRDQIKTIISPLKPHKNVVVNRLDCRCTLCRIRTANKTGSHMVPNFLTHPTFSWDGKGKRDHEALNHDFLNKMTDNCQYYGSGVPEWRFAQGAGKQNVTEEDVKNNINQLEYDNEFCSICENRFGILETAYAQFYNGQQKTIAPRIAYLFWLSVLWRMSMGSMSIFMNMYDELFLRKLLDENILNTDNQIATSTTDLGNWEYAMFRAEGLKDGDKGILGYRKECSPYVVMYNDLVMVFYNDIPLEEELKIGPITIDRKNLNDWHSSEVSIMVDRRWFWNVRDWIVESSYDFYDPVRENALRGIREEERSKNIVISDYKKEMAIKAARLNNPPKQKMIKLHKFYRIAIAWYKLKEAKEKQEDYDPLKDEELFLSEVDFQKYYIDLANLSKYHNNNHISDFPFYVEARKYVPDESCWVKEDAQESVDEEYLAAYKDVLNKMKPKQISRLLNEEQDPYERPYRKIGRNELCPCGSGKKYKKCCGRNL